MKQFINSQFISGRNFRQLKPKKGFFQQSNVIKITLDNKNIHQII